MKMANRMRIFVLLACFCMSKASDKWLGATYWSSRYGRDGVVYRDDRDSGILWNDFKNGRRAYEPAAVNGSSCGHCKCSTHLHSCSSSSSTL